MGENQPQSNDTVRKFLTKNTFNQINDQNQQNLYYDNKNNFNHHDEVTSDTEDIISDEEWGEVNSKSKGTTKWEQCAFHNFLRHALI